MHERGNFRRGKTKLWVRIVIFAEYSSCTVHHRGCFTGLPVKMPGILKSGDEREEGEDSKQMFHLGAGHPEVRQECRGKEPMTCMP